LVDPVVAQQIALSCHFEPDSKEEGMRRRAMEEFPLRWRQLSNPAPKEPKGYGRRFIRPKATDPEKMPEEPVDYQLLREFLEDSSKLESDQLLLSQGKDKNYYYAAIRAQDSCLGCHQRSDPDLQKGDLIAMVRISVPTASIEDGVQINRAILI